jgi:hypothetical protein
MAAGYRRPGFGARRVTHGGREVAEFARANALHDTDVRALIHLLDADRAGIPATAGWLGAQLGLTSPSTTALIEGSKARDMCARNAAPGIVARSRSTSPPRPWPSAGPFFGPLLTGMVGAMRSFSADELDTVERFLRKVAEAVARVTE